MEGAERLGGVPSDSGTLTDRLARAFRVTFSLIAGTVVITTVVFAAILGVVQPRIERLVEAHEAAEKLDQGMVDQQTMLRGFLLTGDQSFVDLYRGRQQASAAHERLRGLIGSDPELRHRLDAVARARETWTKRWALPVIFGPVAQTGVNRSDRFEAREHALFDRYRTAHEALADSIADEAEAARGRMYLLLGTAGALELALCVVAFFVAQRQRRKLGSAIVEPVRELLGAIESAGRGDLSGEVPTTGPLELRQIAAGLREMNAALLRQRRAAAESEARLQDANAELSGSIEELERRNVEARLLNEMGDLLQSCEVAEEAYAVVHEISPALFPGDSGALYVRNPSRTLVEAVARWGAWAGQQPEVFSPEDCWALRRGVTYTAHAGHRQPLCRHVAAEGRATICVPLTSQGDTSGLFHLQTDHDDVGGASEGHREQMAVQVGERMALALANFRLREKLRRQSIRDPLTDLFNRRYIQETLDREASRAQRSGRPLTVIMVDIDHFKRFNDTFGHDAGDAVLKLVASSLAQGIRNEDIACRYGGEEFLLVLPDAPLQDAAKRAEELRERVAALQLSHQGRALDRIEISLGVATFPEHGSSWQKVVQAADAALYRAKQEGRDRVRVRQASGRTRPQSEAWPPSSRPSRSVFHPSSAHLMRTGYFTTPLRETRSPSEPASPSSSPASILLIDSARRLASFADSPLTLSVIIDALACEIEQPLPSKATPSSLSPSKRRNSSISSPHRGLLRSSATSWGSRRPLFRGER